MLERIINFFSKKEVKIFLLCFFIIAILTKTNIVGANDGSRLATIESLIERGTFAIDNSSYIGKVGGDKIYINCSFHPIKSCGHYYSEKPPVLPLLISVLYIASHKFLELIQYIINSSYQLSFLLTFLFNGLIIVLTLLIGDHFLISGHPSFKFSLLISETYNFPYRPLTYIFIGSFTALLLVYFYKSMGLVGLKEKFKILATLSLGIGTMILPYSIVINNHTVAASLLFIGFYIILKFKFSKDNPNIKKNLFIIGLITSLAAVIDYSAGIFLILFLIYILSAKKLRPFTKYFIFGISGPLILHFILNYMITGGFKPAYFLKGAYDWPDSPWPRLNAERSTDESVFKNLERATVGDFGFFSFSPVLIIPFIYLLYTLKNKENPLRKEAWIIFIGMISLFFIYATFIHSNYGYTYGFRYSIILIPLIMFFVSEFFKKNDSNLIFLLYIISLVISIIIAVKGVMSPKAGHTLVNENTVRYAYIYIILVPLAMYIYSKYKSIIKKDL